jgi:hypothetical protein
MSNMETKSQRCLLEKVASHVALPELTQCQALKA